MINTTTHNTAGNPIAGANDLAVPAAAAGASQAEAAREMGELLERWAKRPSRRCVMAAMQEVEQAEREARTSARWRAIAGENRAMASMMQRQFAESEATAARINQLRQQFPGLFAAVAEAIVS